MATIRTRLSAGISAAVVVLGSSAAVLALSGQASAVPNDKQTICHSTNSDSNPYVQETPNKDGDLAGHADHTGPLWAEGLKDAGFGWGDIIPPFDYNDGNGGTAHFPGFNWPAGQATFDNGCDWTPPALSLEVVKTNDADADGEFSDSEQAAAAGDDVTFTVTVTNTGDAPVEIDAVTDEIDGTVVAFDCVDDSDDPLVGQTLAVGATATCTVTLADYAPVDGESVTNTVTVDGHQAGDCDLAADAEVLDCDLVEDPDNTVSDSDDSTVSTPAGPTPTPTETVSPSPSPSATEDTGGGGTITEPSESPSPAPFTGGGGGVTLPHTGFPTAVLAGLAGGIALLGAWLTFLGRRRQA